MNAVVSGQAGVAILADGDDLHLLRADAPEATPCRPADVPYLLGDAAELVILEDVQTADVATELACARQREDALQMALILIDPKLPNDIREEAAAALDELLEDEDTASYLKAVLYARHMPDGADLSGGIRCCVEAQCQTAFDFMRRLRRVQPIVRQVCLQWDGTSSRLLDSPETRAHFQTVTVREGIFSGLVETLAEGTNADQFLVDCMLNAQVRSLPDHRQVLQDWFAPFRVPPEELPEMEPDGEWDEWEGADSGDGHRSSFDGPAAKRHVDGLKAAVVEAMAVRDLVAMRRQLRYLLEFHDEHSDPEHACMSLCDLAKEAERVSMYELQLELTERAITTKRDDGWSWAQHADALLNVNRPHDALEAYEQAGVFGQCELAATGRGHVLKALSRLGEALEAYDEAIVQYPDSPNARSGRADVLKFVGRYQEALDAYDAVSQAHPEDVVAKAGRAEVLKSMGRYQEALDAYGAVRQAHPENVVAKAGRAEVLKSMGHYQEALDAYEAVIQANPHDLIARNGRACVLAAMERWQEALAGLPLETPEAEEDWIGYHIRGMILVRTSQVDEAMEIFEDGVANCPAASSRDYFRTALAVARLRQREDQAASEILEQIITPSLITPRGLLQVHAYGRRGECGLAQRAYEALPSDPWPTLTKLKEELRRRYIAWEEPQHTEEWVVNQEIQLVLETV